MSKTRQFFLAGTIAAAPLLGAGAPAFARPAADASWSPQAAGIQLAQAPEGEGQRRGNRGEEGGPPRREAPPARPAAPPAAAPAQREAPPAQRPQARPEREAPPAAREAPARREAPPAARETSPVPRETSPVPRETPAQRSAPTPPKPDATPPRPNRPAEAPARPEQRNAAPDRPERQDRQDRQGREDRQERTQDRQSRPDATQQQQQRSVAPTTVAPTNPRSDARTDDQRRLDGRDNDDRNRDVRDRYRDGGDRNARDRDGRDRDRDARDRDGRDRDGRRDDDRERGIVVRENDNRVIIRRGDREIIRHDETERLRRGDRNLNVIDRPNGRRELVVVRPNGDRVVTVVDRDGNLIRRYRRDRGGREFVIIDNERNRPRGGFYAPVELPPLRLTIPRDRYIVEAEDAPYEVIEETLLAPPVERVQRAYSLDEVRYNQRVRETMRRVDLDSITFDTGSAAISPTEAARLDKLARAINDAISKNPNEVFLVEGHTDAVGSDTDNLALSDRRAESVATILSANYQIPPENLVTQGYGEQYPKVQTDGAERRNRRVTIRRITPLLQQGQQQR